MADTPYTEAWLSGPSSTNFYTRTYTSPDAPPHAVLLFVHGAAEHIGRHTEAHAQYAARGIAVFAFDQRGFGRTALDAEHKSAHSAFGRTHWAAELEDIEWALKHVCGEFPGLPVFLMGFSLGGTAILGFATRTHPPPDPASVALLAGVIGFAPTVRLVHLPPKPVYWLAKLIKWFAPYALFPFRNNPKDLSRNPETNTAYERDPLVGVPGSLQYVGDAIDYGQALLEKDYARWPEHLPVLFVHGSADNVASPVVTEAFYHKLPAKDKKLILYPGGYHELHNEPEGVAEKVLEDVVAFIEVHPARPAPAEEA